MTIPRVLLADDHRLLREALAQLLAEECEIVALVEDGLRAVELTLELHPDIVVLDVAMPRLNGIEAARRLKLEAPQVKVIVLTVNEEPSLAAEAIRAGVVGYLIKNSAASELLKAIHEVYQGRAYLTPLIAGTIVQSLLDTPNSSGQVRELSPRQRQVLQLLAEGRSMKEVARLLGITPRTVAFHKYKMMDELEIRSTAELVQHAIRLGLVVLKPSTMESVEPGTAYPN